MHSFNRHQQHAKLAAVPQEFQFLEEGGAQPMIMHIMLNRAQGAVGEKGHAE